MQTKPCYAAASARVADSLQKGYRASHKILTRNKLVKVGTGDQRLELGDKDVAEELGNRSEFLTVLSSRKPL